ncbi:hypothetical protein CBR_g55046 [Chara braunii]|uniref:Uncharacterized protein n=1 Tax=Chara braunii TaxID=69332 RepID=A0A388MCI9_CHABU|nr:hypothetical protein CBR_g55046 [Chara braunii]|eukprot:GBG92277.1 hypothetical protein CBR_g55046 [Chara braunii]
MASSMGWQMQQPLNPCLRQSRSQRWPFLEKASRQMDVARNALQHAHVLTYYNRNHESEYSRRCFKFLQKALERTLIDTVAILTLGNISVPSTGSLAAAPRPSTSANSSTSATRTTMGSSAERATKVQGTSHQIQGPLPLVYLAYALHKERDHVELVRKLLKTFSRAMLRSTRTGTILVPGAGNHVKEEGV